MPTVALYTPTFYTDLVIKKKKTEATNHAKF